MGILDYGQGWRHTAAELGQEGPNALMRLPWLMEEILDVWDVAKKRSLRKLTGHVRGISTLAFNPSGTMLATGSADSSPFSSAALKRGLTSRSPA